MFHVRLNLENECRHARLGCCHDPFVSRLRPWRRRHRCKRIEKIADAKILQRVAEEHRRHMVLKKGLGIEALASMAHEIKFMADGLGVEPRVQCGYFGDCHFTQPAGNTGIAVEQAHAACCHVNRTHEIAAASDRPGDRRGVERECFLDLIEELERVAAFTIHLVNESDDRNVAQPAYFKELASPWLDPLGRIDHHHRRVDRGKGPIGIFREVLVARRIKQIEDTAVIFKGHHRCHNGNAALAFNGHPV